MYNEQLVRVIKGITLVQRSFLYRPYEGQTLDSVRTCITSINNELIHSLVDWCPAKGNFLQLVSDRWRSEMAKLVEKMTFDQQERINQRFFLADIELKRLVDVAKQTPDAS